MNKTEEQIRSLIGEKEWKEYKNFAFKDDMLKLTVGIVLGNSFNKVVYGTSDYLIMPIFTFLVSKTNTGWREWSLTPVNGLRFEIGHLIGTFVDFIFISFVLYLFYIKLVGKVVKKDPIKPTKICSYCFNSINAEAKKCPLCTGDLIVETRRTRTKNKRTKNHRSQ